MLDKPRYLSISPTRLINSMKHEHSCKILFFYSCQLDLESIVKVHLDLDYTSVKNY